MSLDSYKLTRQYSYSNPRQEMLREFAKLPGIYVPSLYEVTYKEDGTIVGIERIEELDYHDAGLSVLRRLNGDEDHQGRHLRIPFGQYGVQRLVCYTYR